MRTLEVLDVVTGRTVSPTSPDSHTGTTPSGNQRPIAAVPWEDSENNPTNANRPQVTLPPDANYYDRLLNEYLNAPNEGYVWTIEIHDTDVVDALGLTTATYNVNVSVSHIGPDMFGPYFGSIDFDYSAEMGGLESLLTATGGSVDYDADGWFENDKFVFDLTAYSAEEEAIVEDYVNRGSEYEGMTQDEKNMMNSILGMVYDLDNNKDFEKSSEAVAMWWDIDLPMTDGDMSGYFEMNGVMGGITDASGSVDKTGKNTVADAHVAFAMYANGHLVGTFDERYSTKETFDNPIIYTIKVFPNNEVVITFYSATGGPVTTKCYGTLTKKAVDETHLMGR